MGNLATGTGANASIASINSDNGAFMGFASGGIATSGNAYALLLCLASVRSFRRMRKIIF